MDIHGKSVNMDMDMDGKFHMYGNPANRVAQFREWHFVNPGRLVQVVSCTQEKHKKSCDFDFWPMTLIFSSILEVVKTHVLAKLCQSKCSGS